MEIFEKSIESNELMHKMAEEEEEEAEEQQQEQKQEQSKSSETSPEPLPIPLALNDVKTPAYKKSGSNYCMYLLHKFYSFFFCIWFNRVLFVIFQIWHYATSRFVIWAGNETQETIPCKNLLSYHLLFSFFIFNWIIEDVCLSLFIFLEWNWCETYTKEKEPLWEL